MIDNSKHLYSEHWNGEHYRRISSPQYSINMKFIHQVKMNGDESVLDMGCGNGDTTREIAKLVPNGNVIGIDASNSMIIEAVNTQSRENLSFKLMNVHDMCFDAKFDIAGSFFCMQWVQDKMAVFCKIQRALKVGGRFLMITPMPHPHLPKIRERIIERPQWKPFFSCYEDPLAFINDSDYMGFAERSNLKVVKSAIEVDTVYFASYESFFDFMSEMTPNLKQLPSQDLKNAFMHELLEEFFSIYPLSAEGKCRLDFNLHKMVCYR